MGTDSPHIIQGYLIDLETGKEIQMYQDVKIIIVSKEQEENFQAIMNNIFKKEE